MRRLLLALGILLWGTSASAQPALVQAQSKSNDSAATSIATAAQNHAAGHALLVGVRTGTQSATALGVTNTAGDTFVGYASNPVNIGTDHRLWLFYVCSSAGNASDVVTASWTSSVGFNAITVQEVSGIASSSCLDATATGAAVGTSVTSGTFSTAQASEFAFVAATNAALADTWTAGTGYTIPSGATPTGSTYITSEYQVFSSTQSGVTASISGSASNQKGIGVLTFKATGGGGTPGCKNGLLMNGITCLAR